MYQTVLKSRTKMLLALKSKIVLISSRSIFLTDNFYDTVMQWAYSLCHVLGILPSWEYKTVLENRFTIVSYSEP